MWRRGSRGHFHQARWDVGEGPQDAPSQAAMYGVTPTGWKSSKVPCAHVAASDHLLSHFLGVSGTMNREPHSTLALGPSYLAGSLLPSCQNPTNPPSCPTASNGTTNCGARSQNTVPSCLVMVPWSPDTQAWGALTVPWRPQMLPPSLGSLCGLATPTVSDGFQIPSHTSPMRSPKAPTHWTRRGTRCLDHPASHRLRRM